MQITIKLLCAFIACIFIVHHTNAQGAAYPPMTGFVDMHAHPRGDLAFGEELFFGAPYGDIAVALGDCKPDHNKNLVRKILAAQTEQQGAPARRDNKQGYPDFVTWPAWCSTLHQQMWVDWIEIGHKGGLNVMCALAVSSHTIAHASKGKGPYDDKQVMLNLIQGIKALSLPEETFQISIIRATHYHY